MSGSMVEVLKTTPRMGRRSMALADIDPKYVSQSGIWEASEVETSKGSIRIQHLTAVATSLRSVSAASGATSLTGGPPSASRFPKLEECAHFHYDYVELPVLKIVIREDTSKSITLPVDDAATDKCAFAIEVSAGGQSWVIRRTHANFILLDEQLHRCVWDRTFSRLEQLKESLTSSSLSSSSAANAKGRRYQQQQANSCANINTATSSSSSSTQSQCSRRRTTSAGGGGTAAICEDLVVVSEDGDQIQDNNSHLHVHGDHPDEEHSGCRETIVRYLSRLAQLPTNKITCGTVLSWLELDNRGRHIVSSDDSDINTPAVAAACAVRKYVAQAADEIAFEVGDMISVIDMPPPEESIWWRGKRGFHVGFFPRECVQVIGDKVPAGLPIVSSVRRLQRLSVSSAPASTSSSAPEKPVLRKHGKLIAFFRSFILSRPSRRRLKQSGILRERVFSCDLAEHLLNTGNDIPAVLKCCAEFIEKRGIVDGIYRLSGITSNIQKLRNLFDEDKTPNLEEDNAIKQDIHAVSSLLKMYFRELPNPLCTYQLYDKFVAAAQASDEERLFRMREVVHELPPPHYRTLEYLMKHLARVAQRSNETGMTPKNMAIVWAPNLIRCKELEAGGVDALKGIGVQAVVTEYLVRHADLIFNDKLPADYSITTTVLSHKASCSASGRPKSLAISSPIRLMSLEEARLKQDDRKYIEVGGGPSSLPPKYHTVIDLPSRRSALKNKRSPIGWRQFFSRNRSFSKATARKITNPIEITVMTKSMPMAGPQGIQTNWAGRLRPVKSVESLVSSPMYITSGASNGTGEHSDHHILDHESVLEDVESNLSKSSPATPVMTDVDVLFHAAPHHEPPNDSSRGIQNPKTHNRSISHDSYFEFGEFRNSNRVYIDETLEEETLSQSSKLSLEISSGGESPTRKSIYAKDSTKGSKSSGRGGGGMMSPMTPPPSAASLVVPTATTMMSESVTSTSSDDVVSEHYATPKSPLLPSKWRDSEVQTSHTKLYDVGVCTQEDMEQCTTGSIGNGVVSSSTTASFASSGQRTATTSTSCGVTRDSSAQSLISQSSSGGENHYELDRNSSIDESSVDSTPCEPYAMTNIIYSPLIDDLSSPTSSGGGCFKSSMDPFRVSSDSEASTTNNTAGSRLYVCPLYEAGVSTVESISSAVSVGTEVTDVSSTMSVSPRTNAPRNNQYENVSLINTHKPHNLQVFLCSSSQSLNTPVSTQDEQQQQSVGHVYANQQFYENHPPPVPAIRKSKSEGAVMMANLNNSSNTQKQSSPQPQNQQMSPPAPVAVTNVLVEPEQPIYEKEHYENISEIEVEPVKSPLPPVMNNDDNVSLRLSSHRESNIYEDIDDDDDDELNTGNKYETVEFEKGVMRSRPSAIYNDDSDDEYENVQENPVVIHHHYAEIEERMDTNSVSPDSQEQTSTTTVVIGASSPEEKEIENVEETKTAGATSTISIAGESVESSPSHSHTEDMVTYLEVQTPHLNLRTNSLDDQEDISQQSSNVSGSNKLDKTNSHDSSDTPDNSPGDEGEIRHIDSPINSPVTSSAAPAVNNPLYGMPEEKQVESQVTPSAESKDNMEVQSDDGEEEEMSVNESLSISISMEESPKSKQSSEDRASDHGVNMKQVSRCNSAPLAVGVHEFTVALDRSLDERDVNGTAGDNSSGDDDVFYKSKTPATRSNSSALEIQPKDDVEKRFGEKILLCKRLSEPSLLFSNQNINNSSCMMMAALTSQKTDSSNNNTGGSTNPAGGGASPAAWKIADAKRLANRKQSVKELLSKFETRDSNSSPSPVHSPPSSLPPTGFTSNNKDSMTLTSGGRSPSTNSIGGSTNGGICVGNNGRHQHHRFSTGDILMSQSVSAVENLNCISGGSLPGVQSTNSLIVRSDTFPELSRDDSASKENALHGAFSSERNDDDQGSEKGVSALRVAMSSVDMNDPSRRERIEKYKEERRSFLRQKINSELTAQKSPTEGGPQQIVFLKSPISDSPETEPINIPSNRTSESPRKRAFSEDFPTTGNNNTTNKSIKTDPFSLKCAFLASTTTTTSSTKVKETSLNTAGGTETLSSSSSTTVTSSTKSVDTAEEINVRERVALWSSTSSQQPQKKESQQPSGTGGGQQRLQSTTSSYTISTSTSSTSTTSPQAIVNNGSVNSAGGTNNNTSLVNSAKLVGALSTSTTEFPKVSKPLLRRELTTSAIEISKSKLTKVGRTNSEGAKKIKDMAAFFEAKQF